MRMPGGTIAAIAVAVLLSVIVQTPRATAQTPLVAAQAAPAKPLYRTRAFDGLWSVSIFTQNGSCPASLRYPAVIYNGLVLKAEGEFGYDISGVVLSGGVIIVTVSAGGQSATGHGHLTHLKGTGTWRAAGGQCSGIWNAIRRS
jgi:hypothetical protein